MCADAQSLRNSKGRIALMLGSPRNGGGRPNRWLKTVQGSVRAVPWPRGRIQPERIINMLYTIAVVLVILWLLGLVSSYTMGGFIPDLVRAVPWPRGRIQPERIINMLYTIAVVLVILWLLGLVSSYTMGGFIHVLLVIAIVVILLEVIGGRNAK